MATIGGKKIATTGSNHTVPGPTPAMSFGPPPPPAGPIVAPFAYIALSSSATDTSDKLKIGGDPVLTVGSSMDVQAPGNIPSQATGGDVVTHMVNKACGVFTGQSSVKAGGKDVAATGDKARLNMPVGRGMVAQTIGTLITVDMLRVANPNDVAAKDMCILDPISVASGAVVDTNVDLAISGLIPIELVRSYSSARFRDHTPLGRGGFTHSYHQYIEIQGNDVHLRDGDGRTVVIANVAPRQTAFFRRGRLVIQRDAKNGANVYSLDTRLTRVFTQLGGGRAYLTEIVNTSGQRVRLEYEEERLARIVDTAGRTIVFRYDRGSHITAVSVFAALSVVSDEAPVSIRSREAARDKTKPLLEIAYAYGDDGELVQFTDAAGNSESYAYDGRRRIIEKTLPTGLSFHYAYDDATNRCVRAFGDGGIHTGVLEYDSGETRITGNPAPRVFGWRADGAIEKIATPDGSVVMTFKYDDDLYMLEAKNAAGEGVAYEYDDHGNLVKFTSAKGDVMELAYVDDLLVRRTLSGVVTQFAYDTRGRLTDVKYASGAFLRIGYDDRGRLAAVHGPDGLRAAFRYDEQNNPIEEHGPRGGVRRWAFDPLGRPFEVVDEMGRTLTRDADALGRTTRVEQASGGAIEIKYDALGRVVKTTDELGHTCSTKFAGLRSGIELTRPDGTTWQIGFDTLERPQALQNPLGETWERRFDRAENCREERAFDGRVIRYRRGRSQRLTRVEQPDGTYRAYRYDPEGAVLFEETPHGNVTVDVSEDGRVVEYVLDDPAFKSTVRLEADELGRVVREIQNGRAIEYVYDDRNRCVARKLPNGATTRVSYNEASDVSAIDHDGARVDFRYDLAGEPIQKLFFSSPSPVFEARRVLDSIGRVGRDWVGNSAGTLIDRSFSYDARSLMLKKTDLTRGQTAYVHDDLGRLIQASSKESAETFEYDANDSIKPKGVKWQVSPGGVLAKTDFAAYRYDAASRRTKAMLFTEEEDEIVEYLWDCRNRLREVRKPDGTRVLFAYDAFGRRIRKEAQPPVSQPSPEEMPVVPTSRVTEYVWDGNKLVMEIDSSGETRVFVYEPGSMTPLLQQEKSGIYAVVCDPNGTPTDLIDRKGKLVWSASHSAFGAIVGETGAQGLRPPFRLLGQYHDEETGLSYVRHRYFDPRAMRFLSPDPIGLLGGANLFCFNGSPVAHVDPLGLACIMIGNPNDDAAIMWVFNNRVPMAGNYEVYVHGTANSVSLKNANGSWTNMTPDQLADRIRMAGNYNGTDPIYMNSCQTGRTPNGFAQQLSQNMGSSVQAPNDIVWGQGAAIAPAVGSPDDGRYLPTPGSTPQADMSRQGQWNYWDNGQPRPGNQYRRTI